MFFRRVCGWAETSAAKISGIQGERSPARSSRQAMALVDTRVLDHIRTRSAGVAAGHPPHGHRAH